jgi:hypothetical protein
MTDKHTCHGEIWHRFGFNRCGRGAKYAHEGNWYCKTHHPPTAQQKKEEKKEARRTAFGEKLDAERKAREEAAAAKAETERRAALYPELLGALAAASVALSTGHNALIALDNARVAIAKATGEKT